MSFTSTTLGLTQGDFHRLAVLYNGNMTDILQLPGQGGGSGTVTSATLPLSITNGVISVDLSQYSSTAAMAAYITTALSFYSNTIAMNTAITNALAAYTDTTGLDRKSVV